MCSATHKKKETTTTTTTRTQKQNNNTIKRGKRARSQRASGWGRVAQNSRGSASCRGKGGRSRIGSVSGHRRALHNFPAPAKAARNNILLKKATKNSRKLHSSMLDCQITGRCALVADTKLLLCLKSDHDDGRLERKHVKFFLRGWSLFSFYIWTKLMWSVNISLIYVRSTETCILYLKSIDFIVSQIDEVT